jgi:hypothetical protein
LPDKRSHRGPHPDDSRLFGPPALPVLREAASHYMWLLDRGYPPGATIKLVGDRHRLTQRQRIAIGRCSCSQSKQAARTGNRLDLNDLGGRPLMLDGYNVLTTVEAALAGAVVLVARDDCYRDMASMHGTYRKVEETAPALTNIGQTLQQARIDHVRWYLDSPVSNSGRLAAMIRELAQQQGWSWDVELVLDPDVVLAKADTPVATADSEILDRCCSWINLARAVVERHAPRAWVVNFVS